MVREPVAAAAWAPRASVVVPAHDEATVIGRLLTSLEEQQCARSLEVLVVANGCRDDTAAVARTFADRLPGLTVVELEAAGKHLALRAGDDHAVAFPRIYADADIEFAPGALDALVCDLDVDAPRVGAPLIVFDDSAASAPVRAFYRVYRRLPYVASGLVGLGVYGLSARGRERFGAFPDVTADDYFVQRLFAPEERWRSHGSFVVRTPRRLGALVAVRTRTAAGNRELAREGESTTASTVRGLAAVVRADPARWADVLVYVAVTALGRMRARRFDARVWHRDETSRR